MQGHMGWVVERDYIFYILMFRENQRKAEKI
jgi:hypothetical protein